MFLTKKHLDRRTILKAAGVNLALPFLSAMVPAGQALAQSAARPKTRVGFFYIPHGAIMGNTNFGPSMDKWSPSGAGADFKLSPILSALEPHKKYISSFGNLENALAEPDTQLRLFGKPEVRGSRRLGVTLARGESIAEARRKAVAACAAIRVTL